MGKSGIIVAYQSMNGEFKASTTKAGMARLLGVSVGTIKRGLMFNGVVATRKLGYWVIGETALVRVGGKRGLRVKTGQAGFLGYKGEDGLLKGEGAEN